MDKAEWTFLTVVSAIIGGLIWFVVWSCSYSEIGSDKYTQVHAWAKRFPDVRLMVEDATWEDNEISVSEFEEIEVVAIQLLIQDARRE